MLTIILDCMLIPSDNMVRIVIYVFNFCSTNSKIYKFQGFSPTIDGIPSVILSASNNIVIKQNA